MDDNFILTLFVTVNRANRTYAEHLRQGQVVPDAKASSKTMHTFEQDIIAWIQQKRPHIQVSLMSTDTLHAMYPEDTHTITLVTIQLCNIKHILDEASTVFTDAHFRLVTESIQANLTDAHTAAGLVFQQSQCDTDTVVGVYWTVYLQVFLYTPTKPLV
jgi:hypothetical protein